MRKIINQNEIYLLVNINQQWYRLGKLFFLKDHSICFAFPEIRNGGLLAESSCPIVANKTHRIYLKENGKTTNEVVKFTYHTDGNAHFSLDGKIYTKVKTQAMPINGKQTHLFTTVYVHPNKLPKVDECKYKKYEKRGLARIFGHDVSSIYLSFHTFSLDNFDPDKYKTSNDFILMSKDEKSVLRIVCQINTIKMKEKCFMLIGGFKMNKDNVNFLTAMYPAKNIDKLSKLIGSVDINTV